MKYRTFNESKFITRAIIIITALSILILLSSCSSALATTYDEQGNKVITKTVYVPTYYPTSYHSFYGVAGLGYYNNFYRPVYRPYRARPFVRTRTVKPVRSHQRDAVRTRAVRPVRSRSTGNVIKRTNKGRRQ